MLLAEIDVSAWVIAIGTAAGALVAWITAKGTLVFAKRADEKQTAELAEKAGERRGAIENRLQTVEQTLRKISEGSGDGAHLKATLEFLKQEMAEFKRQFEAAVTKIFDKIDRILNDPHVEENRRRVTTLEVTVDSHAERIDLIESTLRGCPSCANSLRRDRRED